MQGDNGNRKVAYENFAPFEKYLTEIDGTLVGEVDFINIAVSMYNLIEYSDKYSDISVNLLQFKRDEIDTNANVCNANNSSFKYKSSLIGDVVPDGANGKKRKSKNNCAVNILKEHLGILRNAFD